MEIKINKEIRDYYEAVFLGLPLRAVFFSAAGIVLSLIVGFALRGKAGTETISWVITVIMVPFFLFGYKKVNGVYLEKYLAAFIRSEFLTPKKLVLKDDNIYRKIIPAPVRAKAAGVEGAAGVTVKAAWERLKALFCRRKEKPAADEDAAKSSIAEKTGAAATHRRLFGRYWAKPVNTDKKEDHDEGQDKDV